MAIPLPRPLILWLTSIPTLREPQDGISGPGRLGPNGNPGISVGVSRVGSRFGLVGFGDRSKPGFAALYASISAAKRSTSARYFANLDGFLMLLRAASARTGG
jgi:hypothetical protein